MGSRGSFLESGGFSAPAKWETVDYVEGIKVLAPKDSNASISLPERSNTPGTAYLSYRKAGTFDQLRVFGDDRITQYDIEINKTDHKVTITGNEEDSAAKMTIHIDKCGLKIDKNMYFNQRSNTVDLIFTVLDTGENYIALE